MVASNKTLTTTTRDTQALFDTANQPKELWLVEGATHLDLFDFDQSTGKLKVLPFLKEALGNESTP